MRSNFQILEEFLDLIPVSIEERRVIMLLWKEERQLCVKDISDLYQMDYNLKVGNKIYFILNNLVERKLLLLQIKDGAKLYFCDETQLNSTVGKFIEEEIAKKLHTYEKLKNFIGKPPMTKYSGEKGIVDGFFKLEERLLQIGGKVLDVRDILPFEADTIENLKLRHEDLISRGNFSELDKDIYKLTRSQELFKSGLLEDIIVLDKEQTYEGLKEWSNKYGKKYVLERLNIFLELLSLPNYQVVFGCDRIEFQVEIIPDYSAALYWRSEPKKITDRLLIFWHPGIIEGLQNYFWTEYYQAIKNKGKEEAKNDVIGWVKYNIQNFT